MDAKCDPRTPLPLRHHPPRRPADAGRRVLRRRQAPDRAGARRARASTTSRAAGPAPIRPTATSSQPRRARPAPRLTAFGMTKRAGRSAGERRRAGGGPRTRARRRSASSARPTTSTSRRRSASRSTRTSTTSAASFAHRRRAGPRGAVRRRAFLRRLPRQPRLRRSPACRPRSRPARAGSCSATPTAARCPARSARSSARSIASASPATASASTTHDDTGKAVANSLAAVDAGARQIQGTLNGLGERCGNANLTTPDPDAAAQGALCQPLRDRRRREDASRDLMRASRMLDDILNRVPDRHGALRRRLGLRPQGGPPRERHRQGPHDLRARRRPRSSATPASSRCRTRPASPTCARRLAEAGIEVAAGRRAPRPHPRRGQGARGPRLRLRQRRRPASSCWPGAMLGLLPRLLRGRALPRHRRAPPERARRAGDGLRGGRRRAISADRADERLREPRPATDADQGPVNALVARAAPRTSAPTRTLIDDMRLVDFRVRITERRHRGRHPRR